MKKVAQEMTDFDNLLPKYEQMNGFAEDLVDVECEAHRMSELLCVCKSPYNGSRLMFACDYCGKENLKSKAFHRSCLDIPEVVFPMEYYCDRCRNWDNIRHQFSNEVFFAFINPFFC